MPLQTEASRVIFLWVAEVLSSSIAATLVLLTLPLIQGLMSSMVLALQRDLAVEITMFPLPALVLLQGARLRASL